MASMIVLWIVAGLCFFAAWGSNMGNDKFTGGMLTLGAIISFDLGLVVMALRAKEPVPEDKREVMPGSVRCTKCHMSLTYQPGETVVQCPKCGRQLMVAK